MVMASTERPSQDLLRPRNRSVPSYRPTQRSGYTGPVRQFVPGSGEGQHTLMVFDQRRMVRSRSGRPIKAEGSGIRAYMLVCVQ
jgi:hypothetical protein